MRQVMDPCRERGKENDEDAYERIGRVLNNLNTNTFNNAKLK
jgi:hypothetical protein